MIWHWSAAVGLALASCGGAGRAVPTEVEIDWPDAAPSGPAPAQSSMDAAPTEPAPVTDGTDAAPAPAP